MQKRLRIAIQKKGRLNNESTNLLSRCGVKFRISNNALIARSENLPLDILLVRDDDIATMVMDQICDLGIVGENVLFEKALYQKNAGAPADYNRLIPLGFGQCRLSIAIPDEMDFSGPGSLENRRIATSYPNLLKEYLERNKILTDVVSISGSVEIAPRLDMADAICDLVSTGRTLEENGLREVLLIMKSQAVLIQTVKSLSEEQSDTLSILLRRMKGVLQAQESKYILFHAPRSGMDAIKRILPGAETPTILPLEGYPDKLAVHLVSPEGVFWDTLERLKEAGASSILVLPIEKMMD